MYVVRSFANTLVTASQGFEATNLKLYVNHLNNTVRSSRSAAKNAAKSKHKKYSALVPVYDYMSVTVETAGTLGAKKFIRGFESSFVG